MKTHIRQYLILALVMGGVLFSSVAGAGDARTFELVVSAGVAAPVSDALGDTVSPGRHAKRWRWTSVAPEVGSPTGIAPGDTLALNLFPDAAYTARVDRVSTNVNGTVTVRGRLPRFPMAHVLISTTGGRSLGSIEIPETGEHFLIQSEPGEARHMLMELDPAQLDKLEDSPSPIAPVLPAPKILDEPVSAADVPLPDPLDPVTLNIMILYTPAARTWADSSGGGIANVVAQAVARGQLAADNSNTVLTLALVYSGEVAYTESGSSSTDLYRLTFEEGRDPWAYEGAPYYIDSIHDLRDQYSADLVSMFTLVEDTGGLGWLLNTTAGSDLTGFCICRVQQVGWTYTHVHEMGHNMGCHHHKLQTTQPGPGLFTYSAGWRWVGTDSGRYCSVMTYESGAYFADGLAHTRVAYFSDPAISYQGVATGDAVDGDNARTIREIKAAVAANRIPIGEAVDNESFTWTFGGNRLWYGQTELDHDGVDAARSHPIGHSQEAWMQTTITGPGTLGFWWRVLSELNGDYLEFYIDDVLQHSISGSVSQTKSYTLSAGAHTCKWRYAKNASVISSWDCGFVDELVWAPTGSLTVTIEPAGARTAGAQWRRVGTGTWLNSGSTESGLPTGDYTVEFSTVTGYNTPANQGVTVTQGTASITGTYTSQTCTVTFATDGTPGASLTGTSPQTVDYGGSCTAVTANAPANYHFVNWTKSGVPYSSANPLTATNVTETMTLTANFAIDTYTLTYTAGANGSITGTSPQTVEHGADGTTVTAVADAGYHFVDWSDTSTENPRTDSNVTGSISVTANFAVNSYTLTYTAGANGSITGTSPQTVEHGADGTAVTAVAHAGYHFVDWSDTSTENPRTDSDVTGNISVTANFAINSYTLTYTAGANGSITGISPQTVEHGADGTTVTAVADAGYHFVNWSDTSTENPRTDTDVTGNISVTANFAVNTYTLTYTADANGTITGTSPQTVNHGSTGTAVTAVANLGYHFVNWSDASTDNPRTDSNVAGNISVTANFAINSYTLTYTAGANGSITGTSPQTVEHGADGTAVTAVADAGYHFVNWSDTSTENPRTDTDVTGNISVTANFAVNTYTLTYTADANGVITGTSPQTVNHGSDGTAVTAVANGGYHFVDWSDASTANPRTDSDVTGNISVTANFAINVYTVVFETDGTPGASLSGVTTQEVTHGSDCTSVSAVGSAGYEFVYWTSNDAFYSASNPLSVTNVTAAMTLVAEFEDVAAPGAPDVSGPTLPVSDEMPTWTWMSGGGGDGTFRYQLDGEAGLWTETLQLSFTPDSALDDGSHVLYVQERDAAENWSSSGSYAVTVDTTAPVITLLGDNPLEIELHTDYVDPGATALDAVDGDCTLLIVVDAGEVDTGAAGTYAVGYEVADVAGNTATAERTVVVAAGQEAMPLASLPAGVALAAIGLLVLVGRRRVGLSNPFRG